MQIRTWLFIIIGLLLVISTATAQDSQVTYTVQPGDTLFRIALRYGVNMDDLAALNNIADVRRINAGLVLVIPGLSQPTTSTEVVNPLVATTPITHVVQRGETLATIARAYGVTLDDIISANNIDNPNRIFAGQSLNIWTADTPVAQTPATPAVVENTSGTAASEVAANTVSNATQPVTVIHTVQQGEYLSSIARQYGISWTILAEANNITDPNRVYAGMSLTIPDAAAIANSQYGILPASVAVEPGAKVGVGREIVVDLSSQMTYAYEDGVLQRSSLVSTGLPATPTVQGNYSIYHKYDAQTMSGPGYYLPGVQWVMYFYQGYAIHGTYWHNNFGNPMSHGCVNMTNDDALWFYNFANIGTPVHVQL
jgi:LysM repeat protein